MPKLAGLNQKDRRRYASLAREWIEEAELQTRGGQFGQQPRSAPEGTLAVSDPDGASALPVNAQRGASGIAGSAPLMG